MAAQITNIAIFSAIFSDDEIWNEAGDLVVPGGKAIAHALAEALTNRGLKTKPPIQHSFYAWLIVVEEKRGRVQCYLHDLEPWLLTIEVRGLLLRRVAKRNLHHRIVGELVDILKADERFYNIVWGTKQSLHVDDRISASRSSQENACTRKDSRRSAKDRRDS